MFLRLDALEQLRISSVLKNDFFPNWQNRVQLGRIRMATVLYVDVQDHWRSIMTARCYLNHVSSGCYAERLLEGGGHRRDWEVLKGTQSLRVGHV